MFKNDYSTRNFDSRAASTRIDMHKTMYVKARQWRKVWRDLGHMKVFSWEPLPEAEQDRTPWRPTVLPPLPQDKQAAASATSLPGKLEPKRDVAPAALAVPSDQSARSVSPAPSRGSNEEESESLPAESDTNREGTHLEEEQSLADSEREPKRTEEEEEEEEEEEDEEEEEEAERRFQQSTMLQERSASDIEADEGEEEEEEGGEEEGEEEEGEDADAGAVDMVVQPPVGEGEPDLSRDILGEADSAGEISDMFGEDE